MAGLRMTSKSRDEVKKPGVTSDERANAGEVPAAGFGRKSGIHPQETRTMRNGAGIGTLARACIGACLLALGAAGRGAAR